MNLNLFREQTILNVSAVVILTDSDTDSGPCLIPQNCLD